MARRVGFVAVAFAAIVASPFVALADEDLQVEAHAVYDIDADASELRVTVDFALTNQKEPTRSGNVVTSYYFDTFPVLVPDGAEEVTALLNGEYDLPVDIQREAIELEEGSVDADIAYITLDRRLTYRQTRYITFSFTLPGDDPRGDLEGIRVNPAYVAVTAWPWGDAGLSSVEISLPEGFDVSVVGSSMTKSTQDGTVLWTSGPIEEVEGWFAGITGRRDGALQVTQLDLEGFSVDVMAWPGDDEWSREVSDAIEMGVPVLEDLIGIEARDVTELDVVEALDPTLLGYAGWYLSDEARIELSEFHDDHVVLHEIAHLYFNDDLFEERWINEGLADEFASLAVDRIGGESDPEYADPKKPVTASEGAVLLEEWVVPRRSPVEDEDVARTEDYGYNASFWVIRAISEEIGPEGLAAVVAAAEDDLAAYSPGARGHEGVDDWQGFLDLLQEIGGSEVAEDLFRDLVVDEESAALLDERAAAREAVDAHLARIADWEVPEVLRTPLEDWEFEAALSAAAAADDAYDRYEQAVAAAEALDLTLPPTTRIAYEGAVTEEHLRRAGERADAHTELAAVLAEAEAAVSAPRGFYARVGLRGEEPDADLAAAFASFEADAGDRAASEAEALIDLIAGAEQAGRDQVWQWIVLGVIGLVLLAGTITGLILWRRRRRRTAIVMSEA